MRLFSLAVTGDPFDFTKSSLSAAPGRVEHWRIGRMIAAHSIQTSVLPRGIRNSEQRLKDFQKKLVEQGVEISWPNFTH
jgi:hypothetical protein